MQIKKYTAETMPAALNQIKQELGDEAAILHVRKIKDGATGRQLIEVTAGLDNQPGIQTSDESPTVHQKTTNEATTVYPWDNANPPEEKRNTGDEGLRLATPVNRVAPPPPSKPVNNPLPAVRPEQKKPAAKSISRIHDTGRRLNEVGNGKTGLRNSLPPENTEHRSVGRRMQDTMPQAGSSEMDQRFLPYYQQLLKSGVDAVHGRRIIEEVKQHWPTGQQVDPSRIRTQLTEIMANALPCKSIITKQQAGPTVIAVTGPTGVGKTTTIAKMAANAKLLDQRNVSLISADTFRVGAIHQLRTFAYIADIPLTVAYTPDELQEALYRAQDVDLIFIDTVGHSQRAGDQLREIKTFLDAAKPVEVYLTMSATSKESDLLDVHEKFKVLEPSRLIMTKLDETSTPGSILNVMDRIDIPLLYVTTGQTVPDDIEQADPNRLASQILEGGLYAHAGLQVA